jgi:hypothetical protein
VTIVIETVYALVLVAALLAVTGWSTRVAYRLYRSGR